MSLNVLVLSSDSTSRSTFETILANLGHTYTTDVDTNNGLYTPSDYDVIMVPIPTTSYMATLGPWLRAAIDAGTPCVIDWGASSFGDGYHKSNLPYLMGFSTAQQVTNYWYSEYYIADATHSMAGGYPVGVLAGVFDPDDRESYNLNASGLAAGCDIVAYARGGTTYPCIVAVPAGTSISGTPTGSRVALFDLFRNVSGRWTSVYQTLVGAALTWLTATSAPPATPTCYAYPGSPSVIALTGSAYDSALGSDQDSSRWQIDVSGGDFSAPLVDTGWDTVNLASYTATGITPDATYDCRVAYQDVGGHISDWSAAASVSLPPPPASRDVTQVSTDGLITRTHLGLMFRELFDSALGAEWFQGYGSNAIVADADGYYITVNGDTGSGETAAPRMGYVGMERRAELVAQARMWWYADVGSSDFGSLPAINAPFQAEDGGNGYRSLWGRLIVTPYLNLQKLVDWVYTTLSSNPGTPFEFNKWCQTKLWVKDGQQKSSTTLTGPDWWVAATDTTFSGREGSVGFRAAVGDTAEAKRARFRDLKVYETNYVYVTGMPNGYFAQLHGQDNYQVITGESYYSGILPVYGDGDPASLDLLGWQCPFTTINVFKGDINTPSDATVVATFDPPGGIYGGDVYTFGIATAEPAPHGSVVGGLKGFIFGVGNALSRYADDCMDEGTAFPATVRLTPVAPAGVGGESLFTNLYVTAKFQAIGTLTVTPIVDGELITAEATAISIASGVVTRRTFEVALTRASDRSGTTFGRRSLRGTWFSALLEFTPSTCGGWFELEAVELEWEPVREMNPKGFTVETLTHTDLGQPIRFGFGVGGVVTRLDR